MPSLVGFTRTGRTQMGPGSDLVELQGPDGARHTAIVFHPEYRSHNAINAALGVVLSFLESPMVTGLTDLGTYDLGESTFAYPTGQGWSVAEVVRTLADLGEVGGVRAGVELMAQAGQILIEAAETGEMAGVYSHGGLTPWRVILDADGRVQIIGHALPQVEILTFHEQPDRIPREDAFRYCPPERLESRRENFSSDLFGLGLVAFEVMCGKPIYDGLVNDIRAKAARGETSRRIHQFREFLPDSVRALLTTVLRPDFRDRFGSGGEFFTAATTALNDDSVQGVGLREMMQRVVRQQPRTRQELDPAKTSMLSKDELRKMMDDEDAPSQPRAPRAAFSPGARRPADAVPARAPAEQVRAAAASPAAPRSDDPTASTSRAVLPPSRRPPPRTGAEILAPAEAPAAVRPAPEPPASPAAEPPRFGPPMRSGARPNPRASSADHAGGFEAPPRPVDAATPPRAEPPGEAPRPAVGVARLPPSRRPPNGEADPQVAPAHSVSSSASSSVSSAIPMPGAGRTVPPPPPTLQSGDRAKELLARVRASGPGPAPRAAPSPSSVLDRILTSSGGQGQRDRETNAREAEARTARTAAGPAVVPTPTQPVAVQARARTPDAIKSGLRGEPQPYKIARSAETPAQRRRLPAGSTLADVVGLLVGQVVPLRVSLDGRLLGWYRLGPAVGPLPADTRLDTLDPEQTLIFHPVDSRYVPCTIDVHGPERVTRLCIPVATAMPIASLVDTLAGMTDLPAGDWVAFLDGVALEPFHILEDRPLTSGSLLVVKRI